MKIDGSLARNIFEVANLEVYKKTRRTVGKRQF